MDAAPDSPAPRPPRTASQQLSAALAARAWPAECLALIRYLIDAEVYSVARRLSTTEEQAREIVARCALEFLASRKVNLRPTTQKP